ncbi:sugar phosphate nucleotidyltransferase [Algiphilus sp. W345]|uniref:Sugar phosphate nucleotidyltransferase n=1 Tax=Banduia mediterranea TaxID=3075609 RepID=A0ABU2WI22_9GAMM|nr:sugar phosphate nucleotidyltransferase [Algiphilus sp. W345]MDT0497516.1 sugar phosphate nucleotidyltransferase [Algiphilus sp. W345]
MKGVLALVLAGGRGTRLGTLTERRAKPAVSIAGQHRIIDFTLSNCRNSGISEVGVLTQYMAGTLASHLQAWRSSGADGETIRTLAAHGENSYAGTADAVCQNRDVIRSLAPSHVLVLAADHVYKMDYAAMLADHLRHDARLTVGCVEVPLAEASGFGVIEVDSEQRLRGFVEKPPFPRPIPGKPDRALASMGIYLFDTGLLLDRLEVDAADSRSSHDFGKDIIPALVRTEPRLYAHSLKDVRDPTRAGYWRDVGTLDAYWQTSLELASATPPLDLIDATWPVRAVGRDPSGQLPNGDVEIRDSVVSRDVAIGADSRIERSILLPGARVGAGSRIRNAIVDEGCHLPPGSVIGLDPERDRQHHSVTSSGLVLVSSQHRAT